MLFRGKDIFPAIAFLIVVLLVVLVFSVSSYVPYERNALFPKYGIYEGMDNENQESSEEKEEKEKKEGEENPPVEGFGGFGGFAENFDLSKLLATAMGTKPASEEKPEEKKEGFAVVMPRLTPGAFSDQAVVLDKFTKITKNSDINDPNCYSAGLSNSRGALCLSPELIDMLKTRGGNM